MGKRGVVPTSPDESSWGAMLHLQSLWFYHICGCDS